MDVAHEGSTCIAHCNLRVEGRLTWWLQLVRHADCTQPVHRAKVASSAVAVERVDSVPGTRLAHLTKTSVRGFPNTCGTCGAYV